MRQMKIGILAIGNEITSGRIQDTNSAYIARHMNALGWQVSAISAVGDSEEAIRSGIDFILPISDAVTVTGGLGPTSDDITTEMIARYCGVSLYLDSSALEHIKGRFEKLRLQWTDNNAKQAMFPQGAEPIFNPAGTAWGFALEISGKLIVVLPGVPGEVKRMLPEEVIPLLRKKFGDAQVISSRTIKLFGLSESKIDDTLSDVPLDLPGLAIGFYPQFPENLIVLTARGDSETAVKNVLRIAKERIEERLRDNIFAYDDQTLESTVASLMTSKSLTLAVAESLSGGLITDRLTDVPGSSAFLNRGVVAYSNEAKIDILGVPRQIIEKYGAVSEQTARLMAEGVRHLGKTDFGLATTGIAGPSGGSELKPVGTVYIAVAGGGETSFRHFLFHWRERRRIKELTAQWALEMLRKRLVENGI